MLGTALVTNLSIVEDPIDEKEMAKKLKICRQHLAGLRIGGKIPYIPAGRRKVLYQPSEVIGALKVLPTNKAVNPYEQK